MGRGLTKRKNALKKQYMEPLRKYAEQLEQENAALKGDPQTLIGQFIGQFRELYGQNSRLSVLCACLIKKLGESAVLTKEEMELFQTKRINIKWEVGDGETAETAKQYTFTYELQEAPPQGQPAQATEQPGDELVCTDPECALPKDLRHRHTTPAVEIAEGAVVSDAIQTADYQAKLVTEESVETSGANATHVIG